MVGITKLHHRIVIQWLCNIILEHIKLWVSLDIRKRENYWLYSLNCTIKDPNYHNFCFNYSSLRGILECILKVGKSSAAMFWLLCVWPSLNCRLWDLELAATEKNVRIIAPNTQLFRETSKARLGTCIEF